MRHRLAAGMGIAVVVFGLGSSFSSQSAWVVLLVTALAGLGVWELGRCHHPRPLGLLPPVEDSDGARLEARWFCAGCGRTWPAFTERARPPIQVFKGFDESKAREAARRAPAFDGRLRELAVQRSGMNAGVKKPSAAVTRRAPVPVSLHAHRTLSEARNRLTS